MEWKFLFVNILLYFVGLFVCCMVMFRTRKESGPRMYQFLDVACSAKWATELCRSYVFYVRNPAIVKVKVYFIVREGKFDHLSFSASEQHILVSTAHCIKSMNIMFQTQQTSGTWWWNVLSGDIMWLLTECRFWLFLYWLSCPIRFDSVPFALLLVLSDGSAAHWLWVDLLQQGSSDTDTTASLYSA